MLISVRKSICPLALCLAVATAVSLDGTPARSQGKDKQPAVQVKTLDDNKEVLRPIPAAAKVKPAPLEKPKVEAPATKVSQDKAKAPPEKTAVAPKTAVSAPKTTPAAAKPAAEKDNNTSKDNNPSKDKTSVAASKTVTKTTTTTVTTVKTRVRTAERGAHFVPPPPPTVPTMLGDASDFGFYAGMPIEMLSREGLKDKAKEISIQYKDACQELDDHSKQKQEKIERAKEFEGLFQEGVVSRRELEASQKEAGEVNSDIDRLTLKVKELKGLLDRVNKRLAQAAAKKPSRKLIN